MLWKRFRDVPLTIAALLHDVVEDSEVTIAHIEQLFGSQVSFIVDSVTKTQLVYDASNKEFSDSLSKLLWGGMQDVRCLLVKLADRDDNLRSLDVLRPERQIRMAFETQAIYQPVSEMLNYQKASCVEDCGHAFQIFLAKHHLTDSLRLKTYLYSQSFREFDEQTYQLIYQNTANIIWKIEDTQMLKELLREEGMGNRIEILGMTTNEGCEQVRFRFRSGTLLP